VIWRVTYARRAAFVVAALAVLAGSGSVAQRGSAAPPPPRPYTVALSPSTAPTGATVAETLTLTNNSLIPLGSSLITLPAGYSATVVSVTGPPVLPFLQTPRKAWSASVTGGVLSVSANNILNSLLYNETVRVALSVTVPCVAPSSPIWSTQASGSIPFLPLSGFASTGDPSITATGTCSFRFDPISSPQTAGSPVAVNVQTLDANNAPTAAFGGSAVLGGTFGSGHGAPAYSTLGFSAGVATGSATPFAAETGQSLTATDTTDGITGGASNTFDVNPGPAYGLKFVTQPPAPPAQTKVNTSIAPAMTVDVLDQWGNLESIPGLNQVPVTLAVGNDPYGGTTLAGTTTQTSAAGVATFGDIKLNHGGNGFTLNASAGGLLPDTSTGFNVYDAICGTSSCTATNPDGNTNVTTSGTGTTVQMGPSSSSLNCGGAFTSRGSIVTINPAPGFTVTNPLTVTLQFSPSVAPTNIPVSKFVLCITKDGTNYTPVPDCRRLSYGKHYTAADLPCISSRCRLNSPASLKNYLQLVMLMTSDDPAAGLH
jgi:hypothetical protein